MRETVKVMLRILILGITSFCISHASAQVLGVDSLIQLPKFQKIDSNFNSTIPAKSPRLFNSGGSTDSIRLPLNMGASKGLKASVDSMLKAGNKLNPNDDSLEQLEADSGAEIARKGLPFSMKKPTKKEIDVFQASILRAVTALGKQDFRKARKLLLHAEPSERLAQVYKTILLTKAFVGEKDFVRADSVLQACLAWVGGTVWQSYLYNLRIQIFPLTVPTDSARLQFYSLIIQAPISDAVKVNFLYNLLKLQNFNGSPEGADILLQRIVQLAPADRRLDSLYQKLIPNIQIGQGTWERQNLALDLESKLSLYPQAITRCTGMLSLVPSKEEKQALHLRYANLYFKNKDYSNSITAFSKYIENYGDNPEAFLQIARSYDRLQLPKKALIWYDRYLEKYPKQDKTSEIYWLRAWELESQGNYEEATEFYYRQLADFSSNKRGDWANFRVGLCQFKAGNTAAALQAFRAIRLQTNSNAFSAGLFWEARSHQGLGDSLSADSVLLELAGKYPFHFYGHLARQTLSAQGSWPDSLEPWKRFASSNTLGIKEWMKNEMSGYRERLDNEFESEYLGLGKLLQFKLDSLAILTMRTIPAKIKANPWFLYVYARKFYHRQLWSEAYRLGLQLSYKMQPDRWGSAPKEVLRLIFPRPYEGLVQKYATKRSLDPAYIYALMRQESGFDREIKSGAGAIGLMQIMPATGRAVAKQIKLKNFDPYSLVEAEVNISLGTAYLKDLKQDYDNDLYFVLANYNAGPEPAKRWKAAGISKSLEMKIEDVSFWETRDYIKKVMGNYWTYRILWNNRPAKTNRSHSVGQPAAP
jgi:soluble lytic murein transglycosylase-like protein/TolA-binding protein